MTIRMPNPLVKCLIVGLFLISFAEIFNPFIPDLQRGIYGFRSSGAFYLIAFFAAIFVVNSKEDILRITRIFIITGSIVAVYGIYQFINPSSKEIAYISTGLVWNGWSIFMKPISTMIGPVHFGMFMVLSALISVTFLAVSKKEAILNRFFLKVAFILMTMALCISLSRGAYLSFIAGIIYLMASTKKTAYKKSMVYLCAMVIVSGVILFKIIPQASSVASRIASLTDKTDSALHSRFALWPDRINTIIQNPWGLGIGVTGGAEPLPYGWCDNQFISTGVETGFVGLFVFLWIMLLVLKKEIYLLKTLKCDVLKSTVYWITAFTLGFIFNMLTNQTLLLYPVVMYFWFMIGILYKVEGIENSNEK